MTICRLGSARTPKACTARAGTPRLLPVAEAADEIERLGKQCEDLLRHEREVERLRAVKDAALTLIVGYDYDRHC